MAIRYVVDSTVRPFHRFDTVIIHVKEKNQHRFMDCQNDKEGSKTELIFIDGSCLNNGQQDATAGYGICLSFDDKYSFRLEPDSNGKDTSNRAEIQAAIQALEIIRDAGDYKFFQTAVLASSSEHLVKSITEYYDTWMQNGWKNREGEPVMNRDRWERLVEMITELRSLNLETKFWWIPREWNHAANVLRC